MHCNSRSSGLLTHYTYLYQKAPGAHDCAAVNARGGLDLSQQSDGDYYCASAFGEPTLLY